MRCVVNRNVIAVISFKKFGSNRLGSINISTYMTWFANFKAEYSIEDVNQSICLLLSRYRSPNINEDGIKYKDVEFTVAIEFTYYDKLYSTSDSLEYEFEDGQLLRSIRSTRADDSISKAMFNAGESLARSSTGKSLAPLLILAAHYLHVNNKVAEALSFW